MTTEQKFQAAVNVIRNLPKNGPYQPSNELMLRFYSYFKQATQGPCTGSRPAFWDVVGRAKYDAWKKLGDMSKEEAMARYVDELHTIVETMSYSDKVATFLEAPSTEYDRINMDDLELIAGDVIERVRSQPNSPLASREASPIRVGSGSAGSSRSPSLPDEDSDRSDDEYIDTIEVPEHKRLMVNADNLPNGYVPNNNTYHQSRSRNRTHSNVDVVSQEISKAVQQLKQDMEKLNTKILSMEKSKNVTKVAIRQDGFFAGLSAQVVVFMFVWPFVANYLMNKFISRRR